MREPQLPEGECWDPVPGGLSPKVRVRSQACLIPAPGRAGRSVVLVAVAAVVVVAAAAVDAAAVDAVVVDAVAVAVVVVAAAAAGAVVGRCSCTLGAA